MTDKKEKSQDNKNQQEEELEMAKYNRFNYDEFFIAYWMADLKKRKDKTSSKK